MILVYISLYAYMLGLKWYRILNWSFDCVWWACGWGCRQIVGRFVFFFRWVPCKDQILIIGRILEVQGGRRNVYLGLVEFFFDFCRRGVIFNVVYTVVYIVWVILSHHDVWRIVCFLGGFERDWLLWWFDRLMKALLTSIRIWYKYCK